MNGNDGKVPLRQMRPRTFLLIALGFLAVDFAIGVFVGTAKTGTGEKPHIAVSAPYYPDCDALWRTVTGPDHVARNVSAAERRNSVWRALNHEPGIEELGDPVAALAAHIITFSLLPGGDAYFRWKGADMYFRKSLELVSESEMTVLREADDNDDPSSTMAALHILNRHDREADAFLACILRDTERLTLFSQGRPIPLEPVGGAPAGGQE